MSASGSDLDQEDEMAAFMGFSTFGKAPAAKKRKFNPATDSVIADDELKNIDRGGKKGRGSGGNNVPLGKSRVMGAKENSNKNDSDLLQGKVVEKERGVRNLGTGIGTGLLKNLPPPRNTHSPARAEEEEEEDGPRYMDTSLPPPSSVHKWGDKKEDDDGSRYMDTSLPPPIESEGPAYMDISLPPPKANAIGDAEAAEMQERIDRIMASIQPPPGMDENPPHPPHPPSSIPFVPAPFQPLQNLTISSDLPTRPPGVFRPREDRGRGISDTGSQASGGRQGGKRNDEWYLGYYDPAFNENPWERLEKEKGLESVGSWVKRAAR